MNLFPSACLAVLLALAPAAHAAPPKKAAKPEPAKVVRVVFQTEKGEIEMELDEARAPQTVHNFLVYVDGGFFDGGVFHRTEMGVWIAVIILLSTVFSYLHMLHTLRTGALAQLEQHRAPSASPSTTPGGRRPGPASSRT